MQKDQFYIPNKEAQEKIVKSIAAQRLHAMSLWQRRSFLEEIDRNYYCEVDRTEVGLKTKQAVRNGDIDKFVNVIVPVILPHVESAVAFQNSIFLQGYPLFASAGPAKFQAAARQMDAVIEDQQLHYGWVAELQKTFRSFFKYNIGATHVAWENQLAFGPDGGLEVTYAGNNMEWMDLYNTYWDPTVAPSQAHSHGEYAGFTKLYSPVNLMRHVQSFQGEAFNMEQALSSLGRVSVPGASFYVPSINPNTMIDPKSIGSVNWNAWFSPINRGSNHMSDQSRAVTFGMHQVTTAYAWIIPRQLGMVAGITSPDQLQIWRFVIVNDDVLIHAQRMTNAHSYLPIVVSQGNDDGLGYQAKSLAQNVTPMQQLTTALFNAGVHARKKALTGTTFYDPKRIKQADMDSPNRNKNVQVKRDAYDDAAGVGSAVHTLQFNDGIFQQDQQDLNSVNAMAEQITGRNPARQGQFVKGNKTREEFNTIMGNSEGRDITTALSLECSYFTPIKQIVKGNILQYQDIKSLYNSRNDEIVDVSPEELRAANLTFKLADGLVSTSKMLSTDVLSVVFQTLQAVPELGVGYDVNGIFAYLMETQGANIEQFQKPEERVAYEQAMTQWQQAVMMLAQQAEKIPDLTMEQAQELMQQLPPQPTPEQFGWNPKDQLKDVSENTVASKFVQLLRGSQQQGEGQQPQQVG